MNCYTVTENSCWLILVDLLQSPFSSHLHLVQSEKRDSNLPIGMSEDYNGQFRLERVQFSDISLCLVKKISKKHYIEVQ